MPYEVIQALAMIKKIIAKINIGHGLNSEKSEAI